MFDINKIFNFHQSALNLYSKRQEILSSNIANADTPGYQAVDIDFQNEFKKILKKNNIKNTQVILQKTSLYHLDGKYKNSSPIQIFHLEEKIKPDGNTVDMDRERIEMANNSVKYQSSLVFIKNEIKNIIQVLKG